MTTETNPTQSPGVLESIAPVPLADYRGWVIQAYLGNGFPSALSLFLANDMIPPKAIKTRRGSQVYRFDHQEQTFFVKRYPMTGIKAHLQCLLGQNKAQKSWRMGRAMLAKGLSTPRPVFYIHRKLSIFKSEYMIGTQGLKKSTSLKAFVEEHFKPGGVPLIQKRGFIEKLARFMGKLHLNGIYHGDLTARNILVDPMDTIQKTRIYLIDLDSIRSTRWISSRRRIKNLDELGRNFLDLGIVGIQDRARFLNRYLKEYTKEKRGYRSVLEAVKKRTAYRLKRHEQQFYRTTLPNKDRPVIPKG
jgi:tRNA A-37 threonylcarbamoyl transferase component Bud32